MRRTRWLVKKKYRECNNETKLSFLLLSASAVSRYSKQLQRRYSLFCNCQYYQQESDAGAKEYGYWKIFLFVSLSLSTLFSSLSSDQQGAALSAFLHYTPSSYQHQFKQKKKCSACKERNSLFMLSIVSNTHTQSIFRDLPSRQCCFWKNVSAIKWASEQKRRREKDKRTIFWRRCEQMVVIMKNEWTWIYTRSTRYIILRTDGRYVQ